MSGGRVVFGELQDQWTELGRLKEATCRFGSSSLRMSCRLARRDSEVLVEDTRSALEKLLRRRLHLDAIRQLGDKSHWSVRRANHVDDPLPTLISHINISKNDLIWNRNYCGLESFVYE